MLHKLSSGQAAPPIHALWPAGHAEEPARASPDAQASLADFQRPLGQAQATMRKIVAASVETGVARGAQLDLRA